MVGQIISNYRTIKRHCDPAYANTIGLSIFS